MKYYIGVDGGGTKTAYALFDENKNMLSVVKTKGSNHENLPGSFEEAAEIIWEGITSLLESNKLKLSDISGTLMGLAGIDHKFQHDAVYRLLKDKGLDSFEIYNDGFIVTKAGTPDGVGIGLNCGTGTCCNSIDSLGHMLQLSGFGVLSDDEGNGQWIAEQTFAACYKDICLRTHKTLMTELFCEKAKINQTEDELLSVIPHMEGERQNEFCIYLTDTFFEAANKGDKIALEITERMAENCSDLIAAHVKRQNFEKDVINVVLSGSMNVKMPNEIYLEKLKSKCAEKTGRKLNFIKLTAAPVTGCINWLLESN